jgi:hypothetical protein
MRSIHTDVARLSRYFQFFTDDPSELTFHIRRLERLLYLFSTSSSAVGYVQGYHEILVPLYYVFVKGGREFGLGFDESAAIAYFMLHGFVNGTIVGEFFMGEGGEVTRICENAAKTLKKWDGELMAKMDENGIPLILVAFSWITVLFAQMYRLPQLLRLWDFLFRDVDQMRKRLECLIVAQLKCFVNMLKEFRRLELESEAEVLKISRKIGGRELVSEIFRR